ncbi:ParA family protein [Candidatus Saccharibacteria bacterium]|jgi:chromosome partitioning protein|nr:ParA family protein [Candidatus Saccharibacteria bacterium]
MTTVLAVTNQKGGVGKTTTAINIAYYLAKSGRKTLLIDFDPQGNATSGIGIQKSELEHGTMSDVMLETRQLSHIILDTKYKNLQVAPTISQLANTEAELGSLSRRFTRLKNAISITSGFDVVVIDCPPSLSLLTVNALIAARYVLLPVQTEFYALEGLGQLLETMKLIRKNMNPTLDLLGVLPTMVDSRTTLSQQVYDEIKKHFPGKVLNTAIPRNIRLAEAPSHGAPIGVYDRFSKGARAYKAVTKEIIERMGL